MSRTFRTDQYKDTYRDHKHWGKPDSNFKKAKQAERRAKLKQVIREMKDPEEFVDLRFKKDDVWDWN